MRYVRCLDLRAAMPSGRAARIEVRDDGPGTPTTRPRDRFCAGRSPDARSGDRHSRTPGGARRPAQPAAGQQAGSVTAHTIALDRSRPPAGPLPDKYLILSNGTVAGSAAGSATSHLLTGLTPDYSYEYRLVAVRGGKRSPASALLTVSTIAPPVSQARLQGTWSIYAKNIGAAHGGQNGSLSWRFSPVCTAGVCDVVLHGRDGISAITVKLVRAGAVYRGQTVDRGQPCGSGANAIPDPIRLKVRLRVTAAVGFNQAWVATSWTGTMTGTSPYVSAATFYCAAYTFTASLNASPA